MRDLRYQSAPAGKAPVLQIIMNRAALARFNVHAAKVNKVIGTAFAGMRPGLIVKGNHRLSRSAKVADVSVKESVNTVSREAFQRRMAIQVNLRGRDVESFVHEAQEKIGAGVEILEGYFVEYGGAFKPPSAVSSPFTDPQQRSPSRLVPSFNGPPGDEHCRVPEARTKVFQESLDAVMRTPELPKIIANNEAGDFGYPMNSDAHQSPSSATRGQAAVNQYQFGTKVSKVARLSALFALGFFSLSRVAAVTFSANFNAQPNRQDVFLGDDYTEGGIRFQTSPQGTVAPLYGMHALETRADFPTLYNQVTGRVLDLYSATWLYISVPGYVMNSVSFLMGNGWWTSVIITPFGYEVTDQYQMLLNGAVVGSGLFNGNRGSLGLDGEVKFEGVFDQLLLKSNAISHNVKTGTSQDFGSASLMVIDNVVVQATPATTAANVPEEGSEGTLLLIASLGLLVMATAHRRAQGTVRLN